MPDPLGVARTALAGTAAWVVGGAVRDRVLARPVDDVDLVVDGDVRAAARQVARAADGPMFSLSQEFGAWRVLARDRSWRIDLSPIHGGSLEADLRLRDLTVNAIAEPLAGGAEVDPTGGRADLGARILRMAGPTAFTDDPLRVVRLARLALVLGFAIDPDTAAAARAAAPGLAQVAGERLFAELNLLLADDDAPGGIGLLDEVGGLTVVLPEIAALDGVEQNRYHDRDVLGHTLAVLEQAIALERDPAPVLGAEHADALRAVLAEPLADGLPRSMGLRWGALLHDAAKPATRVILEDGQVGGFPGHDVQGAELARDVLTRLKASERLRAHVAALTRHHLRLGFLVHSAPLDAHDLYAYLTTTEPVEVDVTLLSVADRLATRGRKAEESIARHVELAREVLPAVLAWRAAGGRPAPLLRGNVLAKRLGVDPGPELGRLLRALSEAQYAGEVSTPDEAVALARRLLSEP
jgi:tRNA nucleotidyltransferase/poly(A) polymerase